MTTTNSPTRDHVVAECNATATEYPRQHPIHLLFEQQAARAPQAPAVDDGTFRLTYAELDAAANALARGLVEAGVAPGDHVGVLEPVSAHAVVAVLGALKAGAAYVPLDPSYPDTRLSEMCDRADIRVVATTTERFPRLSRKRTGVVIDAAGSAPPPEVPVRATDSAYLIFTSGSSGNPKAVEVPHRGIVRLVRGTDYMDLGPRDTVLGTTNLAFDVSCLEIFGALLNGARLVFVRTETLLSPDGLADRIRREGATVMWLSAGVFHELGGQRPGMFSQLRYLICGGDALNPNIVRAVIDNGKPEHFLNGYGPTENSVLSTTYEFERFSGEAEYVPIGKPIANSTAYVLRQDLSLTEFWEVGELCVGGDGVAKGYYGDPELTRRSFVSDPFASDPRARLYRTGDRARLRPDGDIEFLGRDDRQVKIRGFRIELGDIESALGAHPEVRESVVELRGSGTGRERVVAWVLPMRRSTADEAGEDGDLKGRLTRHLRDRLPGFMVPAALRPVDSLPLNRSGKVDRSRLPDPEAERVSTGEPPRTDTERLVASLWETALGVSGIGRRDDFFGLGGHSLRLTRFVVELEESLGLSSGYGNELVHHMLSNPTVAEFSERLEEIRRGAGRATSERHERFDLREEARLDPDLRFDGLEAVPEGKLDDVLLTGPTGFLGAFLLDRLLRRTEATVHCLTRAADDQEAFTRILGNMRRYGLELDGARHRVVPVAGDLEMPSLGLGDRFDELASRIDAILHNGSYVNFVYPYSRMRAPNVGGTREVLRLAGTRCRKPVHYVSTIATLAGCGAAGVEYVPEDTLPGYPENISMGYPETKWVCEQLLSRAWRRGLPMSIYRPYEVTGTRDRGVWNTDTMMCALFGTIAETGVAPDVPLPLDFVPVDFTAEALVHALRFEPPRGHVYNVTNPEDARLGLVVDRLRARGRSIEQVPYDQWVAEMSRHVSAHPESSLAPFMPMFAGTANTGDMSIKEMYFAGTFPRFGRENLERALAGSGLHCPPVDVELIDLYLDYFEESGFLGKQYGATSGEN
ncbi:hypothetical protein CDG81_15240 [Actinopolyspora erythraea]|uniref:Carrier domain-containing protein n=1 Tax=Actinopolyspora erythraea TaxID=414996 RepID=A0A223RUA0_9ACTN|nr:amino acid adenylation domain-containing protein [Actinopolyspora erythraea]ASU79415.1 hypothetical protein CDG81_15240 [Actinopolyspora erythraea]